MGFSYDFSFFHPDCAGKYIVSRGDSNLIVCPVCGVAADLEAVASKISHVEACVAAKDMAGTERVSIGKQTYGINKGGAL